MTKTSKTYTTKQIMTIKKLANNKKMTWNARAEKFNTTFNTTKSAAAIRRAFSRHTTTTNV